VATVAMDLNGYAVTSRAIDEHGQNNISKRIYVIGGKRNFGK